MPDPSVRPLATLVRRFALDAVVVLLAVGTAAEVTTRSDPMRAPRSSAWFLVPAALAFVLPLLGRRRWPFAAPASVWLAGAAASFVDGRLVVFSAGASVAGLAASFLLGQVPEVAWSRAGLGVVVGCADVLVLNDPNRGPGDLVFVPVPFAIAWLAGFALRERTVRAAEAEDRAQRAERERETAARLAVAEERTRIARELHDIVAHAMSVMVLQVGAVRHHLPEASEPDKDVLRGVESTGRTALTEMRRLLGALRRDDEDPALLPQPGLRDLDRLAEQVGKAGLPVHLYVSASTEELPPALDLSAYRIVQEGLTNTLRHAHASRAEVTVSCDTDCLSIDVRDDGRGGSPNGAAGRGLLGVRERVSIYSGEMTAGSVPGGGFLLRARLPLEGGTR